MCVSDWRLGRMIRCNYNHILVPQGTVYTIPANPQRVGIDINLCVDTPTAGNSMQIGPANNQIWSSGLLAEQIEFRITKHGHMVQEAFQIWGIVDEDANIAWVEYTLPENVISAAVQQFQSEYNKWLSSFHQ